MLPTILRVIFYALAPMLGAGVGAWLAALVAQIPGLVYDPATQMLSAHVPTLLQAMASGAGVAGVAVAAIFARFGIKTRAPVDAGATPGGVEKKRGGIFRRK